MFIFIILFHTLGGFSHLAAHVNYQNSVKGCLNTFFMFSTTIIIFGSNVRPVESPTAPGSFAAVVGCSFLASPSSRSLKDKTMRRRRANRFRQLGVSSFWTNSRGGISILRYLNASIGTTATFLRIMRKMTFCPSYQIWWLALLAFITKKI